MIIGMDHEWSVTEAGHTAVGIAHDMDTAFALASQTCPDLALVDMHLADGETGNAIALKLHREFGTRPIFVTANPHLVSPKAQEISVAVLSKPCPYRVLIKALRTAETAIERAR